MSNFLTDNPAAYERQFPDPEHVAARWAHAVLDEFGGAHRVLDLGCGTGRDAGHLSTLGHEVVGLDSSQAMLAHASARYAGEFIAGDLRDFALGRRFDAILCLDSALLYCHTNAELESCLTRCREHLVPGGLLVAEMRSGAFFLGNTELLDEVRTRTVTVDGTPYTSNTHLFLDRAEQLLRRHRVWEWPGQGEPLAQDSAWRLLFPQELRAFCDHAGFDVLALFDTPGPRTDDPWRTGTPVPDPPLSTGMTGDRLHLVARARS
ncbi:class I SAM-dependent DNA methyltransferase [Actinokineospora bangkokensis]|uniref:SAM-dependent methyltransferase n=1 Tax=Actinokineospora bangkokensis TaxID=1193682 RepID=A0A1Q9LRG0_9PSEU|nr:class I SAM-dependent methyltransferase [Actinokineospora bangkokensis]OLR94615.1 SAM-dependent methyltransferase [Actinokineospora bangkokensis]